MLDGGPGITVQCHQCIPCRVERARQWSVRCYHESKMHEKNCFLTLTYDDEHLPPTGLDHKHWQLFAKKLRNKYGPFRFYMAGEYGDDYKRAHYHAILFGIDFVKSQKYLKKNKYGDSLYKSDELNDLWSHGFCTIGECNQNSANYVAGYIIKKKTGLEGDLEYERVDTQTGEILQVRPPYNNMSRRPGIGATWFRKYRTDVYPHDYVVDSKGNQSKPPSYYDGLLEQLDPVELDGVKKRRLEEKPEKNNTLPRLAVRGKCLDLKLAAKDKRDPDPGLPTFQRYIPTKLNKRQQSQILITHARDTQTIQRKNKKGKKLDEK